MNIMPGSSRNIWSKLILPIALILAPSAVLGQSASNQVNQSPVSQAKQTEADASAVNSPPAPDATNRDPLSIYRQAGITSDQENQIRQLAKEFEETNTIRLETLMGLLHDLKALSLKPDPDEKLVMAKQEEINKLQSDMSTGRIKLLLNIRHLLNPEQKQHLVDLMQKSAGVPANAQN